MKKTSVVLALAAVIACYFLSSTSEVDANSDTDVQKPPKHACKYCNPSAVAVFNSIAYHSACFGDALKNATEQVQNAFPKLCSYARPSDTCGACLDRVREMDNGETNRTIMAILSDCQPLLTSLATHATAIMVLAFAYGECCVLNNQLFPILRKTNTAYLEDLHIKPQSCRYVNCTGQSYMCDKC